jgi:hypothetical protein
MADLQDILFGDSLENDFGAYPGGVAHSNAYARQLLLRARISRFRVVRQLSHDLTRREDGGALSYREACRIGC